MATDLSTLVNEQDQMILRLRTANRQLSARVKNAEELAARQDRQIKAAYRALSDAEIVPEPFEDLAQTVTRALHKRVDAKRKR